MLKKCEMNVTKSKLLPDNADEVVREDDRVGSVVAGFVRTPVTNKSLVYCSSFMQRKKLEC